MTNQKKTEKLARWLDNLTITKFTSGCWHIQEFVGNDGKSTRVIRYWEPFTNIADAGMLVEKAQDSISSVLGDDYDEGHCILAKIADIPFAELKSSEVASAISEIVLKEIE